MKNIEHWYIEISVTKEVKSMPDQQSPKDGMYLSPHVRLAGSSAKAHIESKALAEQYLGACHSIFKKRYKSGYVARIHKSDGGNSVHRLARIEKDSTIIRERLATGNLIPNKKPAIRPCFK